MEVKHKNLKEDFKLLISLGSAYSGEQFSLTFSSGKYGVKTYVCSWDGVNYTNCEMADDTHVLCKFDSHGLPCGLLICDCKVCLPDTSMEDGDFALDSKGLVEFLIDNTSYHLELTSGKSDIIETVEATFELLGTVLKGDPGDGVSDYEELTSKPKINNVELSGNKTSSELGIDDCFKYNENETGVQSDNAIASGDYAFATGYSSTASGQYSHAEGSGTTAKGNSAHAEGAGTRAYSMDSHAEGSGTTIDTNSTGAHAEGMSTTITNGLCAHAEGMGTHAYANFTHSEGSGTYAQGACSHAEGTSSYAKGYASHAEGTSSYAKGYASHAEGSSNAEGQYSHAEGGSNYASGDMSHAEGNMCYANGSCSHAEGQVATANGQLSHAEGFYTEASGYGSHVEGEYSVVSGDLSHCEGEHTIASKCYQHVHGLYNVESTSGSATEYDATADAHIIGNGTSSARSNAFRVTFDGKVYGLSDFNSSGADYAEYFEWSDLNPEDEDRIGHFVALTEDGKIKIAEPNEDVIGIISGMSSVVGNASEDTWNGMYVRDAFGRLTYEYVEVERDTTTRIQDTNEDGSLKYTYNKIVKQEQDVNEDGSLKYEYPKTFELDEDGNIVEKEDLENGIPVYKMVEVDDVEHPIPVYKTDESGKYLYEKETVTERHIKLNPDYDPSKKYIPRSQRKEWDVVGLLGQIVVIDDGTCVVGKKCTVKTGGIATLGADYRVIKRIDDTHVTILANFL